MFVRCQTIIFNIHVKIARCISVFATSLGDLGDFCCCHMLTSIFCLMPWQRGLKSHWKNPWMMVAEDQVEVGPHGLPWIQITGRKICRERVHIPPNGKRRIIDSKVPAGRVYISCKEGMHVVCQVFYIFDGKKWAPDCLAALYQRQYQIYSHGEQLLIGMRNGHGRTHWIHGYQTKKDSQKKKGFQMLL